MKPEKFHRHASFFMCKTTNRQKISGGGIITLYTYATFENTTSDAGTTNVDNKRRI